MCDVPGDYLMTYDPAYTELHSDSSDFEDTNNVSVAPKYNTCSLFKKKVYTKSNKDLQQYTCDNKAYTVTDDSSKEMWESETIISQKGTEIDLEVRQSYQNRKCKILDSGDQIETIKSKRSLIRHKVIPCISSIFGRSGNNVKQMSIINENQAENVSVDNGCQANCMHCEHKMRKFNRKQHCYAVQPVYNVEGNVRAKPSPFRNTKIDRELSTYQTIDNDNSHATYSLTSTSEGTEPTQSYHRKKWKNKKSRHLEESDMEENMHRYDGPTLKSSYQQCPSRPNQKGSYQIYTTPYAYQRRNTGCSPIASNKVSGSELPSTCSGFWDFLFNKINMKYQAQGNIPFRPCKCNGSVADSSRYSPGRSESIGCQRSEPQPCYPSPPIIETCACSTSPLLTSTMNTNDNMTQLCAAPPPPPPPPPPPLAPCQEKGKKVECGCYPKPKPCPYPCPEPTPPPSPPPCELPEPEPTRPCQIPHDEITKTLATKYNGEILCIHNPPCVLINGCLNLPPAKGEGRDNRETTIMCPVQAIGRTGYHKLYSNNGTIKQHNAQFGRPSHEMHQSEMEEENCQYQSLMEMKKFMITDENCQYHLSPAETRNQHNDNDSCQYQLSLMDMPTTSEVKQHKTSYPKREKIIQSICNHNPPCEVVRTCFKAKYNPKLQTSCVHVPMCEQVPLCLMELKHQSDKKISCQHNPKCTEVPICTRNYIVLTAKEEAATQVRPKAKMVCRHEPPCIMIPKCLARVCDSCVPFDAIPDCIHQPTCEMIPACCRKSAKEMVSVCSQYPNQCCIV